MADRLYLFRHGQSSPDPGSGFFGRTNTRLTALGQAQAAAVSTRFPECLDLPVLCSPLERALETAHHAFPLASITIEPLAVERDYGALEGLDLASACRLFPEAVDDWRRWPSAESSCTGEGWGDVLARASRLAERLRSAVGSQVVVSHLSFTLALAAVLTETCHTQWASVNLAFADCLVLERVDVDRRGFHPWKRVRLSSGLLPQEL